MADADLFYSNRLPGTGDYWHPEATYPDWPIRHALGDVVVWTVDAQRLAELRAMPYRQYLATPEWRFRRLQMIAASERKCQRCGRFDSILHVHHRTYDRVGNEHPDDLEVLCRRCHDREHDEAT